MLLPNAPCLSSLLWAPHFRLFELVRQFGLLTTIIKKIIIIIIIIIKTRFAEIERIQLKAARPLNLQA